MQYQFFTVPAQAGHVEAEELNKFLRTKEIVSVEKAFKDNGVPKWYFVVEYLEGSPKDGDGHRRNRRVDYKEVLSAEDFAVFSRLRDLRKELSQAEAVPVFAIINVIGPYLDRYQIADSYACIRKRGTYQALATAKGMSRKNRYYLKLDIRKYFDSINHQVLLGKLDRLFKDAKLLSLLARIIITYETAPGKGLPIGSLTSQYFANYYLAYLDFFIKQQLRVTAYIRYMDDFVLWHDDKDQLKQWYRRIRTHVQEKLKLELKALCLNFCSRGMSFLGYRVFPQTVRLSQRSRQRFIRRFRAYEKLWQRGVWSETALANHVVPLLAFVKHADTYSFRTQVLAQYGVYP